MSIREGAYTVPATAASAERAARQLRQAFNDVFRYVPEDERAQPRKLVDKFARAIAIGEQPVDVYWHRETREVPSFASPEDRKRWQDGDKYAYRDHTVDIRVSGAYRWEQPDLPGGTQRRVLDIRWHMESTYLYHAFVDGVDVAGTLSEVWERQLAAGGRAMPAHTDDRDATSTVGATIGRPETAATE